MPSIHGRVWRATARPTNPISLRKRSTAGSDLFGRLRQPETTGSQWEEENGRQDEARIKLERDLHRTKDFVERMKKDKFGWEEWRARLPSKSSIPGYEIYRKMTGTKTREDDMKYRLVGRELRLRREIKKLQDKQKDELGVRLFRLKEDQLRGIQEQKCEVRRTIVEIGKKTEAMASTYFDGLMDPLKMEAYHQDLQQTHRQGIEKILGHEFKAYNDLDSVVPRYHRTLRSERRKVAEVRVAVATAGISALKEATRGSMKWPKGVTKESLEELGKATGLGSFIIDRKTLEPLDPSLYYSYNNYNKKMLKMPRPLDGDPLSLTVAGIFGAVFRDGGLDVVKTVLAHTGFLETADHPTTKPREAALLL